MTDYELAMYCGAVMFQLRSVTYFEHIDIPQVLYSRDWSYCDNVVAPGYGHGT